MQIDAQEQNDRSWYDVETDDGIRRVSQVAVSKNPQCPAPVARTGSELPDCLPDGRRSILGLMWQAVVGVRAARPG